MAMTPMRDVQYYVDTTPLLNDPEALRQRARQDGCLFFEGLLPQSDVLDVRQQVLDVCARHGWLATFLNCALSTRSRYIERL